LVGRTLLRVDCRLRLPVTLLLNVVVVVALLHMLHTPRYVRYRLGCAVTFATLGSRFCRFGFTLPVRLRYVLDPGCALRVVALLRCCGWLRLLRLFYGYVVTRLVTVRLRFDSVTPVALRTRLVDFTVTLPCVAVTPRLVGLRLRCVFVTRCCLRCCWTVTLHAVGYVDCGYPYVALRLRVVLTLLRYV